MTNPVVKLKRKAKNKKDMKEEFLHFIWRLRRFHNNKLLTTEGAALEILHPGEQNFHSGPDFTNAKIKIGDTLWAGNVEMHLNSSDWLQHAHQNDRAYDNVILHVVLEEDIPIKRQSGERIPCLELKSRIPSKLSKQYLKLMANETWIPCQHLFFSVPDPTRNLWLDRMLVERLEQKTELIENALEQNQNDWEKTFYQTLARNFGVKINAEPFELLAKELPLLLLGKHKPDLLALEALLFGQAGMLEEDLKDDYPKRLQKEYRFLQKKYTLQPIQKTSWKFSRLRPANFPTIRIAQFATLIFQSVHLFSKMLAAKNVVEIENMFALQLSNYWQTHYVFDKPSVKRKKTLGKSTIHLLIINTIAPFLFLYGQRKDNTSYKDRALKLLEELPPEKNNIISRWKDLGVKPESAYQTQALLQLKNEHCKKKKCLECGIGNAVLK